MASVTGRRRDPSGLAAALGTPIVHRRELTLAALAALAALALTAALYGPWQRTRVGAGRDGAAAGSAHVLVGQGVIAPPRPAAARASSTLAAESSAYRVLDAGGGGLAAANPAQGLSSRFDRTGALISAGSTRLALSLRAVGLGSVLSALAPRAPTARANVVTYARADLSEWYANGPRGVEQGFTLATAPRSGTRGALTLALAISSNARVTLARHAQFLTVRSGGRATLRYGGLSATDARGRALHSWMELYGTRLLLRVDARGAAYPVRIDPFVQQGPVLKDAENQRFGVGIALSADGSTALVGEPSANGGVGDAFVFTRSGSTWTQQGEPLTATGEEGLGRFGSSVALSADGSVALIGAPEDNKSQGAAFRFTRLGESWTQQKEYAGGGRLGEGVALSADGSISLVGAPLNNAGTGAAFVFGGGTETMLTPEFSRIENRRYGSSVALSADGETALLGAPEPGRSGSAAVFAHLGSTWAQLGKPLTGQSGEFGASVALSAEGNTALVGAPGASGATLFTRAGSTWSKQVALAGSGEFGSSVALGDAGDIALIGAPKEASGSGRALVYTNTGSGWAQTQALNGGEGEIGTLFGSSVALSPEGTTALIHAEGVPRGVAVFAASSPLPSAETGAASSITTSSATLNARVNPNGTEVVACRFEYGTTTEYGSSAPCSQSPGSGTSPVEVSAAVSGLQDATKYHFRIFAANGSGTRRGLDGSFTTLPSPHVASIEPIQGPRTGGTTVQIRGTHFTGATEVRLGASQAASYEVKSDEAITAVTPPGSVGPVTVTVTTATGSGSAFQPFYYVVSEPPEFGQCEEPPPYRPVEGRFETQACTTLGGSEAFEWYPNFEQQPPHSFNSQFTTAIKPSTLLNLETQSKQPIVCSGESSGGEYSGTKTVAGIAMKLTGCQLGETGGCHSAGALEGEVILTALHGELGVVKKSNLGPAKNKIGLLLQPEAGEALAEFTCAGTPVSVRGSVIVEVKANARALKTVLKFKALGGVQKPTHFEGGDTHVLEAKIGEAGTFEQAGLMLSTFMISKLKVEVNSVV